MRYGEQSGAYHTPSFGSAIEGSIFEYMFCLKYLFPSNILNTFYIEIFLNLSPLQSQQKVRYRVESLFIFIMWLRCSRYSVNVVG